MFSVTMFGTSPYPNEQLKVNGVNQPTINPYSLFKFKFSTQLLGRSGNPLIMDHSSSLTLPRKQLTLRLNDLISNLNPFRNSQNHF
jgi:hypothetical protein